MTDTDFKNVAVLYEDGLSDLEIATIVGTARKKIAAWRFRYQLAPNCNHEKPTINCDNYDEFKRLYEAGLTDSEIALKTGHIARNVSYWRHKTGRTCNKATNVRAYRKTTFDGVFALELYCLGCSDSYISLATHGCIATVRKWRLDNDLPANNKSNRDASLEYIDDGINRHLCHDDPESLLNDKSFVENLCEGSYNDRILPAQPEMQTRSKNKV